MAETIGKAVKSEAQKANELTRLKEWVGKLLKENADKFDITAEYDSAISYEENKTIMREKLKAFIKDTDKEAYEKAKVAQEQFIHEQNEKAEKEAEMYNSSLKFSENKELDAYYIRIKQSIDKM